MIINNKHIQIIVEFDNGNGEGPEFYFETPTAAEIFVDEAARNPEYKGYLISVDFDVDGTSVGSYSFADVPIECMIDTADKIQMLCTIIHEAGSDDCGIDSYFPIVYLVVDGENGKEYRRYCDSTQNNYGWWNDFLDEANDFLNSVDVERLGNFKVYADISPADTLDGQYIVKSGRRVLISDNAIRNLVYEDIEGIVLASEDMRIEGYYDLCDDLYWFTNENAEKKKAQLFGEGYYHAVTFISATKDEATLAAQYADFSRCVVEEGNVAILEAVHIPYSPKSCETDEIAKQLEKKTNGEPFEIDINSDWAGGVMKSVNRVSDEKLLEYGDFITVIADNEYVSTSCLEDEVIPLADKLKVIIIYTDDARFSKERLDKIPSYMVFDMDDTDRSAKTNEFLSIDYKKD